MANKAVDVVNMVMPLLNENGAAQGLSNIKRYHRLLYVLGNYDIVPRHRFNTLEKRMIIAGALKSLAGKSSIDAVALTEAISAEMGKQSKRAHVDYEILFILNVDQYSTVVFDAALDSLRIVGKWRFLSAQEVIDTYRLAKELPEWLPLPTSFERDRNAYQYCLLTVQSADPREATNRGCEAFELVRAWVNFALIHKRWKTTSEHEQQSVVSPSFFVYCFGSDGAREDTQYTIGHYDYAVHSIGQRDIESAVMLLNTYPRSLSHEMKTIINSAVSFYGEALDNHNYTYGFLHLWQAVEILVRSGDQATIQRIIKSLPGVDDSIKMTIGPVAHQRNSLIHATRSIALQQGDFLVLREIVDSIFGVVFTYSSKLRNKEDLEEFWRYLPVGSRQTLENKRSAIDLLLSLDD